MAIWGHAQPNWSPSSDRQAGLVSIYIIALPSLVFRTVRDLHASSDRVSVKTVSCLIVLVCSCISTVFCNVALCSRLCTLCSPHYVLRHPLVNQATSDVNSGVRPMLICAFIVWNYVLLSESFLSTVFVFDSQDIWNNQDIVQTAEKKYLSLAGRQIPPLQDSAFSPSGKNYFICSRCYNLGLNATKCSQLLRII